MDPCFGEVRLHHGANPAVRIVFSNRVDLETANVEYQSVVTDLRCGDITDGRSNCRFGGLAQAQKIEVPCGSILSSDSNGEQHRSLQNEAISVFRLCESI